MSCFFCKSSYHLSQNCNKYASDEDRQLFLRYKKCCRSCLYEFRQRVDRWSCRKCPSHQKCYICFSSTHHTVYCPDRLTASNLFPPKLDRILLPRFMEMLTLEEQYSLFFSFSYIRNSITLKPLKVASSKNPFFLLNYKKFPDMDLMVAENVIVRILDLQNIMGNVVPLQLQSTVFRIKHLEIISSFRWGSFDLFSSVDFLQLLSSTTKTLKCGKSTFLPKINICEILKKAPNLQNIEIHRTNIETDGTWPNQLMEVKNLEKLHLPFTDINFDVESLATFLKTKFIEILLYIIIPTLPPNGKIDFYEKITEKLSNHFTLVTDQNMPDLKIAYIYDGTPLYIERSQKYKLKDV